MVKWVGIGVVFFDQDARETNEWTTRASGHLYVCARRMAPRRMFEVVERVRAWLSLHVSEFACGENKSTDQGLAYRCRILPRWKSRVGIEAGVADQDGRGAMRHQGAPRPEIAIQARLMGWSKVSALCKNTRLESSEAAGGGCSGTRKHS